MHKSGSKKEPNSYVSQIEVFPIQDVLTVPLENYLYRKHCVSHLEGTGRDSYNVTDMTHGNVDILLTLHLSIFILILTNLMH